MNIPPPQLDSSSVKLISGDLSFLKGQKQLGLSFAYDSMRIEKFSSEQAYVDERVKDLNAKQPGRGDQWLEDWNGARKARYEPKFEVLINEYLFKRGVSAYRDNKCKYQMIVRTLYMETGNVSGAAFLDFEFNVVDTANPSVILAKLMVKNVYGARAMGFSFKASTRISESYAKAGKLMGIYLIHHVLKKKS